MVRGIFFAKIEGNQGIEGNPTWGFIQISSFYQVPVSWTATIFLTFFKTITMQSFLKFGLLYKSKVQ